MSVEMHIETALTAGRGAGSAAEAAGAPAGAAHGSPRSPAAVLDRSRARAAGGIFGVDLCGGGDSSFFFGIASAQGRRAGMEDAHAVSLDLDGRAPRTALFAVFDGHAGREVAAFCARHIAEAVVATPSYAAGKLDAALSEAYLRLDDMMKDPGNRQELAALNEGVKLGTPASLDAVLGQGYGMLDADSGDYLGPKAGCTACVALVRGCELFVANVGDSRCVLAEAGGRAVALTRDHKPEASGELERVIQAGLSVRSNRVVGPKSTLAMSRALGDTKYKDQRLPPKAQAVSAVPETAQYLIGPTGTKGGVPCSAEEAASSGGDEGAAGAAEFMVLACDGLWDCMSNEQAVAFLREKLLRGVTPQQAAHAVVDECLAVGNATPTGTDNITVMVVSFEPAPGTEPAGAEAQQQ